jgi:glc operon protein GlcG
VSTLNIISSTNARRYVDKALQIAEERQTLIAVVVVDRAGTIIAAGRSDNAAPIAIELARRKAALSAALGAPTHLVVMTCKSDPVLAAALPTVSDHLLLPGGMPVIGPGGIPEGGVGVAGGHYEIDQGIAEATVRGSSVRASP